MKLNFRNISIEDKNIFERISNKNMSSESAFGTSYFWSETFGLKVCFRENFVLKKITSNFRYEFPRGDLKDIQGLKEAVLLLKSDSSEFGKLEIQNMIESEVKTLQKILPEKFSYREDRNNFEYIYSIESLANLSGKKYHSKRNHISKFNKLYNWKYNSDLKSEKCLEFFQKWFSYNTSEEKDSKKGEYLAIKKAIDNFSFLNLSVGTIELDGEIIACTIGEKLSDDMLIVHFEKAFSEYEGAYSVINNEFCKNQIGKYKLVNREEDMGIPGLRKSKLSYKPKFLLKKYIATWEE